MSKLLHRQYGRLKRKEDKLLNEKPNAYMQSTITPALEKIEAKIPPKLKSTLDAAFYKSFQLVFEKGTQYIEKTYNKDKIQLEHDVNNYAMEQKITRKHMRNLDSRSKLSRLFNTSLSVVEGSVLGILGIGIPDIPLFIALLMRTVYEVALSYGYDYNDEAEQIYILQLIATAMSQGEEKKALNDRLEKLGRRIDQKQAGEINLQEAMRETSDILSDAMLTAKFIQTIPIVGIVGGIVNYNISRKIGKLAALKYKKRYLLQKAVRSEL